MTWNYGDMFDDCARYLSGDRIALIHGDRKVTWRELTVRSNNLARSLLEGGAQPGDKVSIYLRNCPEYVEALVACFKARLVPVNVNYRYLDDELEYIFDNSDTVAVIHAPEFADRVEALTPRLPAIRWLEVGGSYETAVDSGDGSELGIERSADDLLFIYTGGTTGRPKAVMWRNEDVWHAMHSGILGPCNDGQMVSTIEEQRRNLDQFEGTFNQLIASPLMHGTGLLTVLGVLSGGGGVVTLTNRGLDATELWDTVEANRVRAMVIVGDAFAKPMVDALEQHPGRWDISSVEKITSSGVMWSPAVKQALLSENQNMLLLDAFGSSEAVGFGTSITTAGGEAESAKFVVGEGCKVFNEAHEEVLPGSNERGFIARPGPIPIGYYKDAEKSAKTFPTINGVRYAIPGDWCTVDADGTLHLLGRGSACINSGGEKIYPEEIEETLKEHPDVDDALVFGVEDPKWGQAVTAVVSLREGASTETDTLRLYVRSRLADYKAPKAVYLADIPLRGPNGKPDYQAAKTLVEQS